MLKVGSPCVNIYNILFCSFPAPNLKGRPRKKKMKQKRDMESDSNDSDFTPGKEERAMAKINKVKAVYSYYKIYLLSF